MTKNLLIIAAGPLQVPAFQEAAALGLRTVAVDANPLAPGMALADVPYAVDIFDVVAIEKIARAEKIDGVMTLCTDAPVRIVASVAAALGLPAISPGAAANATDKRLMRKALLAKGASVPGFFEVENIDAALSAADAIGYPVALKIACSSGSRGVYRVDTAEDMGERFIQARKYQHEGDFLIEEWMDGPEVSVEGVCRDGQVHVIQVTDKLLFPGAFPVEAGHIQPSRLSATTVAQIKAATENGVLVLGFNHCAFHAELKVTRDGPKIVEIGARLGGDRISTHLTPLSTGVNLVRAAIQIAVGENPYLVPSKSRGAAVRYFHADKCGAVERIEGLDKLPSLPGLELLYAESERDGPLKPGFEIGEICSSLDRYGYVLFSGDSANQAAERAEQAASMVKFYFRSTR
jgi:biotin carboxylase